LSNNQGSFLVYFSRFSLLSYPILRWHNITLAPRSNISVRSSLALYSHSAERDCDEYQFWRVAFDPVFTAEWPAFISFVAFVYNAISGSTANLDRT